MTQYIGEPSEATIKNHAMYDAVYSQDNPATPNGGWIQWKGTNVCMDVRCECGADCRIDQDFFYFYECYKCHRKFAVGQNIKFIPLTNEQYEHYKKRGVIFHKDEKSELVDEVTK